MLAAVVAVILAIGAFLAGLLKVGFGQGSGPVALPLYTLVVPASYANGVLSPLLVLGDLQSIRAYWRQWETRLLLMFLPGQIAGVVLGAYALAHLNEGAARRVIGGILVSVVAAYLWARVTTGESGRPAPDGATPPRPRAATAFLVSLAAGFTSSLAQIGSGVLSVYLVRLRTAKRALVPTLNATFFFSNLVKISMYVYYGIVNPATLKTDLWLAPAALAGGLVGIAVNRRVSQRAFELIVLGFALVAGLKLLLAA